MVVARVGEAEFVAISRSQTGLSALSVVVVVVVVGFGGGVALLLLLLLSLLSLLSLEESLRGRSGRRPGEARAAEARRSIFA